MKTIGILGGMSPQSTITYYREINRLVNQTLGKNYSAPLLMVSVNFEDIVQCQQSGNWEKAGKSLAEAAQKLEQIGAQGIVLSANTMHKVAQPIIDAVKVPFLHIVDASATAIKAQHIDTIALLGTRFVMQDNFYRDALQERGIQPIVPDESAQQEIHRIIFDELSVGKFLPQSKQFYLDTIAALEKQGAQGVVLGCTEIGLLIQQADYPLPFFDTAELHAKMAADFVLETA
ncbi:aspartate/glutamate racemase family protein [Necropsobacter massiliensis]|uniref:aspartate/glutamate racemase family protein n=1 Tax=Necropsobacter massiliensis TaxID=1400001 RepID=UPI000595B82F|nr:aspartate/glutamate racemase family protein [Necropsobacter massiliensis]